jgi:hypothetical protein
VRLVKPGLGPRSGLFVGVLALSAVGPIAEGVSLALEQPILRSIISIGGERVPNMSAGESPWSGTAVLYLAVGGLSTTAMAVLAVSRAGRRLMRAVQAMAVAAIATALLLGTIAAVRYGRCPDPDTYLESLPALYRVTPWADEYAGKDGRERALLKRPPFTSPYGAVTFRRDEARGLEVDVCEAERERGEGWIFINDTPIGGLFVRDIASGLAPPLGWIAGALVAGAGAAAFLAFSLRWRRRTVSAHLTALEATHLGGGQLECGDGAPPFFAEAAARLLPGPVLLLGVSGRRVAYRGGPIVPTEVINGTLDEVRAALLLRHGSDCAIALGVVLAAVTPLVVAAAQGLVF